MLDQLAADAAAPRLRRDEKVLKVAIVAGGPTGAVTNPMNEADRGWSSPGERAIHRLRRIEQARPCDIGDGSRNIDFIEGLIAAPQRQPGGAFALSQRANLNVGGGHSSAFLIGGPALALWRRPPRVLRPRNSRQCWQ